LLFDIDSCRNVFVLDFPVPREHFGEDIQPAVAVYESYEMIAAFLRFNQRVLWGIALTWEDHFSHGCQRLDRSFLLNLDGAIGAVVPMLECQGFLPKLRHRRHDYHKSVNGALNAVTCSL
jgi:hypothetical protein